MQEQKLAALMLQACGLGSSQVRSLTSKEWNVQVCVGRLFDFSSNKLALIDNLSGPEVDRPAGGLISRRERIRSGTTD